MLIDKTGGETIDFLLKLFETSPASIIVHDLRGKFLYVNQKTLDLYGYSLEELQNLTLNNIEIPGTVPGIHLHMEQLKKDGEAAFEVQHHRKDGTKLTLLINAKLGQWDGQQVVLSIATDITQQQEKYQSLIKNIPDVVWTSDENGNTPFISDGVTRMTGFTPEEYAADGTLWFGRTHPEDIARVKLAYDGLINRNALFDIEYRFQRKDGTWIWVHDRAATTYTKNGIRYADGVLRDITDRRHGEEELRRHREHLEDLVKERTRELETKNTLLAEEIAERKRAEDALRESETTFRTLAESSPNMIFINQERRVVYANQRCVEVMGYSQGEFYAPTFDFMSLIAPEHQETIQKMFQRHSTGVDNPTLEYTIISKDGKRVDALYGSRLMMYRNKPAILGVITDITERKKAEQSLQKSEARLKDAQALGRLGNWEFDIETQQITWSDQTYHLYGRDPALGSPSPEEEGRYYTADQLAKSREYGRRAMEEGRAFKYDLEAHLPSGKSVVLFVTVQPIKDAQGRVVKLFGTVQDITENRRAEEKLTQMNQFLDLIIDNIPLIITVKDARTLTYQRVNRTFAEQSKMDPTTIIGKTAEGLFLPSETSGITDNDLCVIQSKTTRIFEGRETRTGRIYRTKKIPILNSAGDVVYLLSIADDVTEQIKIEQERQVLLEDALQLSDLKSSLLSQAAHEMKTPLTVIMGWVELLYNAKKLGKKLDENFELEDIETILQNADRLNNLINDFLDVGRIDSGKLKINKQDLDFIEVVENATSAVNYLAAQKDIGINAEMAPSIHLSVDRRRMEQVIINLFSNAIKYSPEHTRVTLKAGPIQIDGRRMFQIEIIDEGYGFTLEELAEAMTPFGKTATQQEQKKGIQGTGLGLFISRRIIEEHGGTLVLRSEGANKGTQAEILLPMD